MQSIEETAESSFAMADIMYVTLADAGNETALQSDAE